MPSILHLLFFRLLLHLAEEVESSDGPLGDCIDIGDVED
jgi:hypothetical protein